QNLNAPLSVLAFHGRPTSRVFPLPVLPWSPHILGESDSNQLIPDVADDAVTACPDEFRPDGMVFGLQQERRISRRFIRRDQVKSLPLAVGDGIGPGRRIQVVHADAVGAELV